MSKFFGKVPSFYDMDMETPPHFGRKNGSLQIFKMKLGILAHPLCPPFLPPITPLGTDSLKTLLTPSLIVVGKSEMSMTGCFYEVFPKLTFLGSGDPFIKLLSYYRRLTLTQVCLCADDVRV